MLNCSATIVYPEFSTLSIVKNNITLRHGNKSPVVYNAEYYGLYECLLNASGLTVTKKLKIKERGNCLMSYNFQNCQTVTCTNSQRCLTSFRFFNFILLLASIFFVTGTPKTGCEKAEVSLLICWTYCADFK